MVGLRPNYRPVGFQLMWQLASGLFVGWHFVNLEEDGLTQAHFNPIGPDRPVSLWPVSREAVWVPPFGRIFQCSPRLLLFIWRAQLIADCRERSEFGFWLDALKELKLMMWKMIKADLILWLCSLWLIYVLLNRYLEFLRVSWLFALSVLRFSFLEPNSHPTFCGVSSLGILIEWTTPAII